MPPQARLELARSHTLTPGERAARGKAARNEVPRSSHGRWEPAVNRPDPVKLLEEQAVAWILLMLGRDDQDPLFLQAKEVQESVLERFVGKSQYDNSGQRVVAGSA